MLKHSKPAIWFEIMRPFSWTAAAIPVAVGSALAWAQGHFRADLFWLTLIGSILLQAGTNVINELYDLREGCDTLETPRASKVLVQGRLTEREAYIGGLVIFGIALAIGCYLAALVTPWLYLLTVLGVLGGYFYTGKPIAYKYRALGIPLVFFLMGPFMVWGAYIVQTGVFTWTGGLLALPVASLVSAILHANDLRDIEDDQATGVKTAAMMMGRRPAALLYYGMLALAYLSVIVMVVVGRLSPWALISLITLPLAVGAFTRVQQSLHEGSVAPLATLDQHTAKLHLAFGLLLSLGLIFSGVSHW